MTAITAIPDKLTAEEIRSMNIETSLLAVQLNRANLMEEQLKQQMVALQEKNDTISKLNSLMAIVNGVMAKFPSNSPPDAQANWTGSSEDFFAAVIALGYVVKDANGDPVKDDKGNLKPDTSRFFPDGTLVNSALQKGVTLLKSEIDNLSSTQQLDMLRVQSLSNKRNEAFEMMTTFIKKFSDMLSAVIRNMA